MTKRRTLPTAKLKSGSYRRKLVAGHNVLYHRHYTKWQDKYQLTPDGYGKAAGTNTNRSFNRK